MAAGEVLVRPELDPREEKKELWIQTWRRLERFLPDLKAELFPPLPAPPVTENTPAPAAEEVTPTLAVTKDGEDVVLEGQKEEAKAEKTGEVEEVPAEVRKSEVESEID